MNGKIFDLRDDLLAHLEDDWTVEKMAAKTGFSLSHFAVVFKQSLGMSPAAFLKEPRLVRAKHLLETTHEQIQQIGVAVGMTNESHFTRDFKARFGLTPTQCRRIFNDELQAKWLDGHK